VLYKEVGNYMPTPLSTALSPLNLSPLSHFSPYYPPSLSPSTRWVVFISLFILLSSILTACLDVLIGTRQPRVLRSAHLIDQS
jgi:hypothetical protein